MNKLEYAIREIRILEEQAEQQKWIHDIHPLGKLILTILYVILVVSFNKYNCTGLLGMSIYPLVVFLACDIPFGQCLKRIWIVLPLLIAMGIFNPFFDHKTIAIIGKIPITGGMVSMLTFMIKGFFTILAVYLLIVTTSIQKICVAMSIIRVPQVIVMVIMFSYRYISVLLNEAHRMTQAYSLRAPRQKGISFRAWGSFIGQLLLRSMDRAMDVYDNMCLRGFENFDGKNSYVYTVKGRFRKKDLLWVTCWSSIMLFLRWIPLFDIVGNFFI